MILIPAALRGKRYAGNPDEASTHGRGGNINAARFRAGVCRNFGAVRSIEAPVSSLRDKLSEIRMLAHRRAAKITRRIRDDATRRRTRIRVAAILIRRAGEPARRFRPFTRVLAITFSLLARIIPCVSCPKIFIPRFIV